MPGSHSRPESSGIKVVFSYRLIASVDRHNRSCRTWSKYPMAAQIRFVVGKVELTSAPAGPSEQPVSGHVAPNGPWTH